MFEGCRLQCCCQWCKKCINWGFGGITKWVVFYLSHLVNVFLPVLHSKLELWIRWTTDLILVTSITFLWGGWRKETVAEGTKDIYCYHWIEFSLFCYNESVKYSAYCNFILTFKTQYHCWQLKLMCYRVVVTPQKHAYFTAVVTLLVHSGVWSTKHSSCLVLYP